MVARSSRRGRLKDDFRQQNVQKVSNFAGKQRFNSLKSRCSTPTSTSQRQQAKPNKAKPFKVHSQCSGIPATISFSRGSQLLLYNLGRSLSLSFPGCPVFALRTTTMQQSIPLTYVYTKHEPLQQTASLSQVAAVTRQQQQQQTSTSTFFYYVDKKQKAKKRRKESGNSDHRSSARYGCHTSHTKNKERRLLH